MSVLVKGMEMPKTEEESRLLILTPDGVTCLTKLGTGNQRFDTIEVPPHGRLIDVDKLEEEVCCGCKRDCIDCAIANAPTVILADKDG